jgi:hypothetical protein
MACFLIQAANMPVDVEKETANEISKIKNAVCTLWYELNLKTNFSIIFLNFTHC